MELFVCSSMYQLYNAIIIVKQYNIDADLLIIRKSVYDGCNISLLENSVFKNVYIWHGMLEEISDENNKNIIDKIYTQLKKILLYFKKDEILNSIPNKNRKYKFINIAYIDYVTLWLYSCFKHLGAELSLFEDGTYTYGCLAVHKSTLRKCLEKYLFNCAGIDECCQVYIRDPNRIVYRSNKRVYLKKIEDIFNKDYINDIIMNLYDINECDIRCFDRKVIYFDQNMEDSNTKKKQKNIALTLQSTFGQENVLVKLHPSSRDRCYPNDLNQYDKATPFEIIMEYCSMDEKILISIFSTACFSPKIIYDKEPYVIFLYKLFAGMININEIYLKEIDALKQSYKRKNRVIVPENMEEFLRSLEIIKGDL